MGLLYRWYFIALWNTRIVWSTRCNISRKDIISHWDCLLFSCLFQNYCISIIFLIQIHSHFSNCCLLTLLNYEWCGNNDTFIIIKYILILYEESSKKFKNNNVEIGHFLILILIRYSIWSKTHLFDQRFETVPNTLVIDLDYPQK